jgi:hypothetical protein
MAKDRPRIGSGDVTGLGLWQVAVYVVVALTILRLAFLRLSPLELDPGEALRWMQGQSFAWGYGAAPPLTSWLEGASAWLCGSGEACARGSGPLLQAAAALTIGAAGMTLGGWRLGAWSMLVYATLPGVALSSMQLTGDAPLLFFWALALLGVLRLRKGGGMGWAAAAGIAAGLGVLSSYAGFFFPVALGLYLLLSPEGRRTLGRKACAVMAIFFLLVISPHSLWIIDHGGLAASVSAKVAEAGLKPAGLLAFLGWQLVIFGPISFYLFLSRSVSRRPGKAVDDAGRLGADDRLLLLCLSLPVLCAFLLLSLSGAGSPGSAASAYVAACLLAAGTSLSGARSVWLRGSLVVQGLIGPLFYALVWATPEWPSAPPFLARVAAERSGWRPLGQAVARELTSQSPPVRLLIEGGVPAGLILYYSHVPPGACVLWVGTADGDGLAGSVAHLEPGEAGPFLLLGGPDPETAVASRFTEVQRVSSIIIPLFTGEARRFQLYRLAGFQGYVP